MKKGRGSAVRLRRCRPRGIPGLERRETWAHRAFSFLLQELRMPSQVPRPVPAKNAGTRTGQPLDLRFYLERMGQPPAQSKSKAADRSVRSTGGIGEGIAVCVVSGTVIKWIAPEGLHLSSLQHRMAATAGKQKRIPRAMLTKVHGNGVSIVALIATNKPMAAMDTVKSATAHFFR